MAIDPTTTPHQRVIQWFKETTTLDTTNPKSLLRKMEVGDWVRLWEEGLGADLLGWYYKEVPEGPVSIILREKSFSDVVLRKKTIVGVQFEKCSFDNANLSGTTFKHCNFWYCSFKGADMSGTKFRHTLLTLSHLDRANMTGTSLKYSMVNSCTFQGTILKKTRFSEEVEGFLELYPVGTPILLRKEILLVVRHLGPDVMCIPIGDLGLRWTREPYILRFTEKDNMVKIKFPKLPNRREQV